VTGLLVVILCLVDRDSPAMDYVYEAMDSAKESIKKYYEDHPDDDIEFGIGTSTLLVEEEEEEEVQPQEEEHVHTMQQDPFPTMDVVDVHGKGKEASPSPLTPSGIRSYSYGGQYKRRKGC